MERYEVLIGELANKSGFSRDTLRYYEKLGMIVPNRTKDGNYRDYDSDILSIVRFIKRTKELGFTLVEIKAMIPSQNQPYTCATVFKNIQSKVNRINEEIDTLNLYKKRLSALGQLCKGDSPVSTCGSFDTLWNE